MVNQAIDRGTMRRFALAWTLLALIVLSACLYFGNPFGIASRDPRARLLGFSIYRFSSDAMLPTIAQGDLLLIGTFVYASGAPERGDIVAFLPPGGGRHPYVMRVIATAGETIAETDGVVHVNGRALEEPYKSMEPPSSDYVQQFPELAGNSPPQQVPEDHFFVLGDNRGNARDSRFFGPVPRNNLIG